MQSALDFRLNRKNVKYLTNDVILNILDWSQCIIKIAFYLFSLIFKKMCVVRNVIRHVWKMAWVEDRVSGAQLGMSGNEDGELENGSVATIGGTGCLSSGGTGTMKGWTVSHEKRQCYRKLACLEMKKYVKPGVDIETKQWLLWAGGWQRLLLDWQVKESGKYHQPVWRSLILPCQNGGKDPVAIVMPSHGIALKFKEDSWWELTLEVT